MDLVGENLIPLFPPQAAFGQAPLIYLSLYLSTYQSFHIPLYPSTSLPLYQSTNPSPQAASRLAVEGTLGLWPELGILFSDYLL